MPILKAFVAFIAVNGLITLPGFYIAHVLSSQQRFADRPWKNLVVIILVIISAILGFIVLPDLK